MQRNSAANFQLSTLNFQLNIVFRQIYNPRAHCIFGGFVYIVYSEFPEDIFTMAVDGVKAQVLFCGNFFSSLA